MNHPAFPTQHANHMNGQHCGMELRDYFAAAALTGFRAHPANENDTEAVAKYCFELAESMMKVRRNK